MVRRKEEIRARRGNDVDESPGSTYPPKARKGKSIELLHSKEAGIS